MENIRRNIVVFDCEIKNVIDGRNVTWNDHDKMGISVACLFDYMTGDYVTYMDDNLHELPRRLAQAELVVGFNIKGFDLPLVAKTPECKGLPLIPDSKIYDILEKSRMACGWKPGKEYSRYPSGLKLDDHLRATFGPGAVKTDHGANAPLHWQNRKLGTLVSYCLADVKREKQLFDHIVNYGWVKTAAHGTKKLEVPFSTTPTPTAERPQGGLGVSAL